MSLKNIVLRQKESDRKRDIFMYKSYLEKIKNDGNQKKNHTPFKQIFPLFWSYFCNFTSFFAMREYVCVIKREIVRKREMAETKIPKSDRKTEARKKCTAIAININTT